MMELRQVRYFLAVAEHQNFRRAAESLHVAQSAVSKQVSDLEAKLGVKVFDRSASGVQLTQAGRAYAEEARRAIDVMARAELRALRAARGEIDRLTIAMNDIGARNHIVGRSVATFAAAYPEVHLDFETLVSQEQLAALRHRKIDAGIMIERPNDPELDCVHLGEDPFWIALPAGHPLSSLDSVPVTSLAAEPFVSVAMSTYWLPQTRLLARCRSLGLSPRIVQEASNDRMQLNFIAAGLGVGFVNASMRDFVGSKVVLRPVDELGIALSLDLVWLAGASAPSLQHLIAIVREAARSEHLGT